MSQHEDFLAPAPIELTIAGRDVRLSYPFRAVIQYQRETARIERSRPQVADPDPRCLCGANRSQHTGASIIRLGDNDALLCAGFRAQDPLQGDSLFIIESWLKIDLNIDPERWLACLWCGMHEKQANGNWRAPFTLAELEEKIGVSSITRAIGDSMFEALQAWMPEKKKTPNVAAPGEPAPASQDQLQPSSRSGPELVSGTDLPAKNS